MGTSTPGSQSALREANLRRVLRAVRTAGSLTQAEIVRSTGLSAATVSNLVRKLQDSALVVVTPSATGRRAQIVSLSQLEGLAVGIDLGQAHLRCTICDLDYQVRIQDKIPYNSSEGDLGAVEWLVRTLLQRARLDRDQVRGVGVSVPGLLDSVTGAARSALVAGRPGTDIAEELSDRLGLPVRLVPAVHAAALGELTCGVSRSIDDLVYIQLSTSVEAALVLGGEVYSGSDGLAGQFGHIAVDESDRICRCGRRGCLETVVGGPYLVGLLPGATRDRPTLRDVVQSAVAGDFSSRRVIGDAGRAVGTVAAMVCNVLNPRQIVLGGELAMADELLLDPIRQVLRQRALPAAAELVDVRCGELGDRAVVFGAVATVVREIDVVDGSGALLA
ncbi:MAG TPA: ROK family transcriptional regulator [Pseudonocardiaceae bacterium]